MWRKELVLVLDCRMGALLTTYLGLPLGACSKATLVENVVEEGFQRRLAMWKRQYLSKGTRLNMVKNTLSSLPICCM